MLVTNRRKLLLFVGVFLVGVGTKLLFSALNMEPKEGFEKLKEFEDNWVEVLIWPPNEDKKSVGHAAIRLCDEKASSPCYISLWPENPLDSPIMYLRSHRGIIKHNLQQDIADEFGIEPWIFHFYTLNKEEMAKEARRYEECMSTGEMKYHALPLNDWEDNCCTMIGKILETGGIGDLFSEEEYRSLKKGTPLALIFVLQKAKLYELEKYPVLEELPAVEVTNWMRSVVLASMDKAPSPRPVVIVQSKQEKDLKYFRSKIVYTLSMGIYQVIGHWV